MQDGTRKKELSEALGRVVSRLRQEANLSARSVAYGMNMSKTTLLLAEQGRLDPQISTFCKFAEAFYKKPDELMKMVMSELSENWFQSE
ncbi:helix-turn-helix transcriptional regulator [bacterium]|nr:helix-turn-helix transcriptional regulator [bacterium]